MTVEPGSDGGRVLVVVQADVGRICRDQGALMATGGAVGAVVAGGSVLLALFGDPVALLAVPVGAGAAAAGYSMGVSLYRRRVDEVEVALEVLLDALEGGG
ncbi:MAG: hypothetical protein QOG43_3662 [Actinomycetota bacterium]|nr:hypothetical protein [Actinomycetota bacterium]